MVAVVIAAAGAISTTPMVVIHLTSASMVPRSRRYGGGAAATATAVAAAINADATGTGHRSSSGAQRRGNANCPNAGTAFSQRNGQRWYRWCDTGGNYPENTTSMLPVRMPPIRA